MEAQEGVPALWGRRFKAYRVEGEQSRRLRASIIQPFYSRTGARATSLGGVWNGARIAAIGGKAVVLQRLAGGSSDLRRIRRVRRQRISGVVRLGRRWGRCIHIDAFAVEPRSRRVLRGRDAGAQKQRCQNERKVLHPMRTRAGLPGKQTPRTDPSSRAPSLEGVALWPYFFDDCRNHCPSKM